MPAGPDSVRVVTRSRFRGVATATLLGTRPVGAAPPEHLQARDPRGQLTTACRRVVKRTSSDPGVQKLTSDNENGRQPCNCDRREEYGCVFSWRQTNDHARSDDSRQLSSGS